MAKCKHETKNGICEIHSSYSYCHLCDSENLCKGYEPKTNADRIRAMSDEELEPTILAFKLGYAPWCDHHCKNEGEYGCDTCILNWLKQPAEATP